MNYIVVIIPKLKFYKVIFEDEFKKEFHNEFDAQNNIISTLKTFGLENNEFTVDLYFKDFNIEE